LGSCAIEVDYGSDVFQNHHEKNDTPGQNDQVHHTHNISNQNHPHQIDTTAATTTTSTSPSAPTFRVVRKLYPPTIFICSIEHK
jgi:hypothetical protein